MESQKNKYKVLIVDDEPQIRRLLRMTLETNEYGVIEAGTVKEGLLSITMEHPDIILLDLGLPDDTGLSLLNRIREWSTVPVIVITVKDDEIIKIKALDSGADDYVTKPFNTGELLARIRVAIRHSLRLDESPVFVSGSLIVDMTNRTVTIDEQEVKLTATEYALLSLFARNAGKVLTHSFISQKIWSNPYADNAQILRVHIGQIRKKIEKEPSVPELLITEPGVGYRLKILPSPEK
jgi:two-component system KDP operon response regulator KdpE